MSATHSTGLQQRAVNDRARPEAGPELGTAMGRALRGDASAPARLKALPRQLAAALLAGFLYFTPFTLANAEELVSFRCALAIDTALAELDEQSGNPVIQQALSTIDDVNGQLVCIEVSSKEIQVRLQSTDMKDSDNRLVFSIDARTYSVLKTFYGR